MIEYVELDAKGKVTKTRCMKCGDTIATLKEKNGKEVLVGWSHYKAYNVVLQDGTFAALPVCKDCYAKITEADYPEFEKAMRYGWLKEQSLVYKGREDAVGAITNTTTMSKTKGIVRKA